MALVRRPLKSDNAPLNWTVAARDVVCPARCPFLEDLAHSRHPASLCHVAVTPPHVTPFTSHSSCYTHITLLPERHALTSHPHHHLTPTLSSSFFAYFLLIPHSVLGFVCFPCVSYAVCVVPGVSSYHDVPDVPADYFIVWNKLPFVEAPAAKIYMSPYCYLTCQSSFVVTFFTPVTHSCHPLPPHHLHHQSHPSTYIHPSPYATTSPPLSYAPVPPC